jgi:hypothetical protein
MNTFNWAGVAPKLLRELISNPDLSAGGVVARLARRTEDRPTRSALLGYLGRNPSLQELWSNSRRRPKKKVAPAKPTIAAVNGVAISRPMAAETVALPRQAARRVPLLELRLDECRFPIEERGGNEVVGRHLFCGLPVSHASGRYCPRHPRIVFVQRGVPTGKPYVPRPKRVSKLLLKKKA